MKMCLIIHKQKQNEIFANAVLFDAYSIDVQNVFSAYTNISG